MVDIQRSDKRKYRKLIKYFMTDNKSSNVIPSKNYSIER
jgi:hypothetical protein